MVDLHDAAVADGKWPAAIRSLELLGRHLGMWTKHPIQTHVSVVNYHDTSSQDRFSLDELDTFVDRHRPQAKTVIEGIVVPETERGVKGLPPKGTTSYPGQWG